MRYKIETERTDLFDTNILITMRVRLNEAVPFEALHAAFIRACRVHEVLNMKVVLEPSGEAYYIENEVPHNSFVSTDLSLQELINNNEKKRFLIEDGEFIRCFLSPEGIIFMMHHLGGDGKSLLYFIETFFRCLAGEECEPVPFRSLTLEELPKKSRLPFVYGLLVKFWNGRWQKEQRVFTFEDLDKAYDLFWKDRRTVIDIRNYDREELEKLLSGSKAMGVTLTSYLIADMLKNVKKKADVGLAVDGRLNGNRSMGNQATGIAIKYRYYDHFPFEDHAKCINMLLKKRLSDIRARYFVLHFMGRLDPTLTDALNMERAGYFKSRISSRAAEAMGYGSKTKDISITNLTRADIPLEYGPYKIEDIAFIPPVIAYGKNVVGIVTAGDTMNVVWHVYEKN